MINPLYLQEFDDMPDVEQKERFRITNLSELTWAMRKLTALKAKENDVNAIADAEVERIESYRKKELAAIEQSRDFFQSLIGEYAAIKRQDDPNFKREVTPYGAISFRKQQPKWNYDDQKLVQHLKENGLDEFIRIKEEPVKTEIKKQFKVDNGKAYDIYGQEVEGITVEYLPDKLDVKVGD